MHFLEYKRTIIQTGRVQVSGVAWINYFRTGKNGPVMVMSWQPPEIFASIVRCNKKNSALYDTGLWPPEIQKHLRFFYVSNVYIQLSIS